MENRQLPETVPAWDGNARGWRRYQREVMWYWLGTKKEQRKLLAPRLVARLTGPARLLAMSWNQAELAGPKGVANLISKLQASPLVRKKLPNTAAVMSQYFNYKRHPHEGIQAYLVRESLYYEEFIESLLTLQGGHPELTVFDLMDDDDDGTSSERSGGYKKVPARDPDEPAAAHSRAASPAAASGGKPSGGPGSVAARSVRSSPAPPSLNFTDSFILTQLRGWRLLSGAALTGDEWRSILASTGNKLGYEDISTALATLFDEQVHFRTHGQVPQVINLAEQDTD